MTLVEQEVLYLPEHMSSSPVFSRVVAQFVAFQQCFVDQCVFRFFSFFLVVIVFSIVHFTASGYPPGIFKFFLTVVFAYSSYRFVLHLLLNIKQLLHKSDKKQSEVITFTKLRRCYWHTGNAVKTRDEVTCS